jgi:hypothetical protein
VTTRRWVGVIDGDDAFWGGPVGCPFSLATRA